MKYFIGIVLAMTSLMSNSQELDFKAEDVTGLRINKVLYTGSTKTSDGTKIYWKDSVVNGFSFILLGRERYFELDKVGAYKTMLLDCTKSHPISYKHAKAGITAKYVRKISWVVAFGGMIPFLITFYDGPNFENQTMRWTGGGVMIGGFFSVALCQGIFERKITKACRTF